MSCPGDAELIAFLDGSLAAQAVVSLEAHVAGCEDCAEVVAAVGGLENPGPEIIGDRYRIEALVGRGGMGEVWSAFDPELERRVAVKLIRAQLGDSGSRRLVREARALARLQDPNVVAVYDVGESDGEMYVVTELVDGETLETWQKGRERDEVIEAYLQAARGLVAAHRQGLVHRDVKPSNVFVGVEGRVRVGDFGLAIAAGSAAGDDASAEPIGEQRPSTSRATARGVVAGTPAYMAPEQRTGVELDARADQFALSLCLAEALLGERPRAGASAADLAGCRGLAPVLSRGLSMDPGDRFGDMSAWAEAVGRASAAPRRRWARVAVGLVLAASLATVVVGGVTLARSPAAAPVAAPDDGGVGSATSTLEADAGARTTRPPIPDAGAGAPMVSAVDAASAKRAPPAISARSTPRATAPAPPPLAPAGAPASAGKSDALERARRALFTGDSGRCLRAIDNVGALTGKAQKEATAIRARCEMLAGDCRKGSRRLAALSKNDPNSATFVSAEADAHCRPDRGDVATRLRRLYVQVSMFATHQRFGCAHYEKPALALAAAAGVAVITNGKAKLASVFNNLAECHAKAGRCDDARSLLDSARASDLAVLTEISGCSD